MSKYGERSVYALRLRRFVNFSVISISTLALDFFLLWVLTAFLGIYYIVSATLSFLVASILNYHLNRKITFPDSKQTAVVGFLFFSGIIITELLLNLALLAFLVEKVHLHYLVARLISSIFVGLWSFYLNARFNFRVL